MAEVVTIKYEDLINKVDVTDLIYKAYGPNGLGALTVSGIPQFVECREKLLPIGHELAHKPEDVKKSLEHEESMYNVGWSFGKEKLGDTPDTSKGSFYGNPLYDSPASEEERKKYPFAYSENIWPKKDLPELEPAFKNLGKVMYDVVVLLSEQIDNLTQKHIPGYDKGVLFRMMSKTQKIKGRLLYYYPTDSKAEDGWIGYHNDSGFLTALTSAMFFDDDTGKPIDNPDPEGGLWIVDRKSGSVKVRIPKDHLAIQCGECLQIITGGLLVATPHCVRPSKPPAGQRVGRATFPVFVDTNIDYPLTMPSGCTREQVFDKTPSSKVPPLESRWKKDGVTFGEFLKDTFEQYYSWTKKAQES